MKFPPGMTPQGNMPEIPLSSAGDLHNLELADRADLVVFMAGNQFMAMGELVDEFQRLHPSIRNIFYETLPPGLELKQIVAGGARLGDRVISAGADVYASVSEVAMRELDRRGLIKEHSVYLHNRLVIMVAAGNPRGVRKVEDLALDEVRVSQPGEMEDITSHIITMYVKAGGDELRRRVMDIKRAEGTTMMTIVHHRETPLRIRKGTCDAGPVWATEVTHAVKERPDVEAVEVGEALDQRKHVNYFITKLKDCKNRRAAEAFIEFIKSERAQRIYEKHGFLPHYR